MKPQGPRGKLITGCLHEFRYDILAFLERCAREYGDFVPVRVAARRGVLVSDPDAIEEVLVTRNRDFRKVFTLRYNRLFLGDGLLTSEGRYWMRQRRLVQPCFHPERIADYVPIMAEEAERTAREWSSGGVRDMQQEMMRLTLRVVSRCLFGTEVREEFEEISRSIDTIQSSLKRRRDALVPLPDTLPVPGNISLRRAVRRLDKVVYRLIERSREVGGEGADLVSALLSVRGDGRRMTNRQVRDEVMTMFFAGHETTANALTWSWYLLAGHPDVDESLRQELATVGPEHRPSMESVRRLTWTTHVIKEALRLYPPVYAFGREALRDTTVAGHRVPARTSLVISPWVVHRDPRFFARPGEFLPQRWRADAQHPPRFAYLPFSGGARQCIGKSFAMTEAVVVLAHLARRFRPELVGKDRPEFWPTFTLRAKAGIPMTIARPSTSSNDLST